jgi:hypothetical protein
MRIIRIAIVATLALCVAGTAVAGDLKDSAEKAASADQTDGPRHTGGARVETIGGLAIFATAATNKKLGAAGISLAFGGGLMMFLGTHASRQLPTVTVGKGTVGVSKHVTW